MSTVQYLDFQQLKAQTNIIAIATQLLSLKLKQNGSQYRGECPFCRAGGERALAINTDKQSFYCFGAKLGGDSIALVAHIKHVSARDAANEIATFFKFAGGSNEQPAQQPQAPQKRQGFNAEEYLKALDPASELLAPLGLSAETLQSFRAGYCKSGVNRGKLAIALCDRDGVILGFAGRALDGSALTFPNGLDPKTLIFGQDKIGEGEVRLVRDPLEVMLAFEAGETCLCFVSDNIEPMQLEMLAALLDSKAARLFF